MQNDKKNRLKVKIMPNDRPILVYDGDCNFCCRWIDRWKRFTQDRIEYESFQKVSIRFTEIPLRDFQSSVQLIDLNGEVFNGAEAVFRTLAYSPKMKWMLWAYEKVPFVAPVTEWFYSLTARNRPLFSSWTRFLWGEQTGFSTYFLTRWIFLRMMGIIYLVAFVSLWTQIDGLSGTNGIIPVQKLLGVISERIGPERYRLLPSLCWLNPGEPFLHFLCGGGTVLSFLLIFDILPGTAAFFLWLFYLSLVSVCRDFLEFQWDNLLLEAGFLSILFSPLQLLPKFPSQSAPSNIILFLLRWLLFRLMFASGVVKWLSGDPAWRNLTALNFHYETQPLPTWIGWYAHHLPEWFQRTSVAGMFFIELAVPFLFFAPRQLRRFACFSTIAFQLLIFVSGNYCFFNLLTIALCILLLDDFNWPNWLRKKIVPPENKIHAIEPSRILKWFNVPITALILFITTIQMSATFRMDFNWPEFALKTYSFFAPFRTVNSYGLFTVMTISRPEIIIEGSRDGKNWIPYEFKYKAGDLKRPPAFVAPHQPRLDWQMWFAALGHYQNYPWFMSFCERLLQGSRQISSLMSKNPFPDSPPQYIRALLYEYRFTDPATQKMTGNWWRRELKGLYCPELTLQPNARRQ